MCIKKAIKVVSITALVAAPAMVTLAWLPAAGLIALVSIAGSTKKKDIYTK